MRKTGKTSKQEYGFINCRFFSVFLLIIFQCFPQLLISQYKSFKTEYKEPKHLCEDQFSPFQEETKSNILLSLVLGQKYYWLRLLSFMGSFM